jgi:hypothetical protein
VSIIDMATHTHQTAPKQFVEANGIRFAHRRFGKASGVSLVLIGTMDHWDLLATDPRSHPARCAAIAIDLVDEGTVPTGGGIQLSEQQRDASRSTTSGESEVSLRPRGPQRAAETMRASDGGCASVRASRRSSTAAGSNLRFGHRMRTGALSSGGELD